MDESAVNAGNFRELVKLISTADPLLREHLARSLKSPGTQSYLSADIQNEIVDLVANQVRDTLLTRIRRAKYFGLLVDSSPDIAHRDQVSLVVRYVDVDYEQKSARVRESFLGFGRENGKDAGSLVNLIMTQLEKYEINFANCRSQCYDNANVMAGHRTGVSKRLLTENDLAVFVNCDNHSLRNIGSAWRNVRRPKRNLGDKE